MSSNNDFISRKMAGSRKSNEPRLLSEILTEFFASNEPLAAAYRDRLFKNIYPHTELDVNLKLLTREQGRLPIGKVLDGILCRDGEDHYSFLQNAPEKKRVVSQRNADLYRGSFINVHMNNDGVVYPTLRYGKLYSKSISFKDFCYRTAKELCSIADLIEELYPQE